MSNDRSVFINCPFDEEYADLLFALVFTLHRGGFKPCCSKEFGSSGTPTRLSQICDLVRDCPYHIHDLSRVQSTWSDQFQCYIPRFNMPFELGLALGNTEFSKNPDTKRILILESKAYRFDQSLSDLKGYDPTTHDDDVNKLIEVVAMRIDDWRRELGDQMIQNPQIIKDEFQDFTGITCARYSVSNISEIPISFMRLSDMMRDYTQTL